MDTQGHERQATEIGVPMLQAALERAGKHSVLQDQLGKDYLGAFYLGNWLTDLSQLIDPPSYKIAQDQIFGSYVQLYQQIYSGYMLADKLLPDAVMKYLAPIRELLVLLHEQTDNFKKLLKALEGGADSDVGKALTRVTRVMAYFKFSHPENPLASNDWRLSFDVFDKIFAERYTQYYPHEHLDRWPDPNSSLQHNDYTTRTADKTRASAESAAPHIYEYLVANVEMTAGLMAEIDLWANKVLAKNGELPVSDEEKVLWGMNFAKLGHALHACEDYFAHSTFIEHAYESMDGGYAKLEKLGIKRADEDDPHSPWTLFRRRLTKVSGSGTERHVVTGTFDFQDTIHSLTHVAELLGGHAPEGGESAPHPADRAHTVSKLLTAVAEGVRIQSAATDDDELTEAKAKEYAESVLQTLATSSTEPDVRKLAAEIVAIHPDAETIRDDLLTAVALLTRHPPGMADVSIYALLNGYLSVQVALINTGKWLEELVKGVLPGWMQGLLPMLKEQLSTRVFGPIRDYIDEFTGRHRIGSHSLIAKDYAWDRPQYDDALNALYHRAWACSAAVHWYVIKTLTRWSEPMVAHVSRSPFEEERTANATLNRRNYLDWQECLEFFLRHPHGEPRAEKAGDDRWWLDVIEENSWQAFPGYVGGTDTERSPKLPHMPDFTKTVADLEALTSRADTLRDEAEKFYNSSATPTHLGPPVLIPMIPLEEALPPVEHLEGVKKRLQILGLYDGPIEPPFEEAAKAATRKFQQQHGLNIDGVPGPSTQRKLVEVVGR